VFSYLDCQYYKIAKIWRMKELRKEKGIGDSPSPTTLSAYPETHPLHL
jgi:hypothetical protein